MEVPLCIKVSTRWRIGDVTDRQTLFVMLYSSVLPVLGCKWFGGGGSNGETNVAAVYSDGFVSKFESSYLRGALYLVMAIVMFLSNTIGSATLLNLPAVILLLTSFCYCKLNRCFMLRITPLTRPFFNLQWSLVSNNNLTLARRFLVALVWTMWFSLVKQTDMLPLLLSCQLWILPFTSFNKRSEISVVGSTVWKSVTFGGFVLMSGGGIMVLLEA